MLRVFGAKLRYLRHQHGQTQADVARQLGLASHTHISHLEAGRKFPSLDLAVQIAHLFGVTIDYLLCDTIPVERLPDHRSPTDQAGNHSFPLSSKLRHLRVARGMTQKDVADRLPPYTQAHISLLELGGSEPSVDLVLRLAELFDVTTDYLLRDTIPVE